MPDATTIWLFREQLTRAGAIDKLFGRFDGLLKDRGYLAMSVQIVDASLVRAPRQHLDDGEKTAVKAGKTAAEIWPDQPAKAAQKDIDARWTVKFSKAKPVEGGEKQLLDIAIPRFGYQSHIGIDRRCGLIRIWIVTNAAAHDGARLREGPIDPTVGSLGGHRLPLGRQRGVPGRPRQDQPYPPQEAQGQAAAETDSSGQRQKNRRSAPASSLSSATKRDRWAWSSAPSALPAPRPRSGSPIWPIT